MHGNGTNYVTEGNAGMTGMNDEAWIKANIEVVDNLFEGEFENIRCASNRQHAHSFLYRR